MATTPPPDPPPRSSPPPPPPPPPSVLEDEVTSPTSANAAACSPSSETMDARIGSLASSAMIWYSSMWRCARLRRGARASGSRASRRFAAPCSRRARRRSSPRTVDTGPRDLATRPWRPRRVAAVGRARVALARVGGRSLAFHAGVVGESERAGARDGDALEGAHREDGRAVDMAPPPPGARRSSSAGAMRTSHQPDRRSPTGSL